jgi:hypothetical protein
MRQDQRRRQDHRPADLPQRRFATAGEQQKRPDAGDHAQTRISAGGSTVAASGVTGAIEKKAARRRFRVKDRT